MTLRISLRDGEKMIVNGAVLRAAGRVQLVVENNATVMRGRDVMKPEEANTPARRLYFACMLAYIDAADREAHQHRILDLARELMEALHSFEPRAVCVSLLTKVAAGELYQALADCRWLIDYEAVAMARLLAADPAGAGSC